MSHRKEQIFFVIKYLVCIYYIQSLVSAITINPDATTEKQSKDVLKKIEKDEADLEKDLHPLTVKREAKFDDWERWNSDTSTIKLSKDLLEEIKKGESDLQKVANHRIVKRQEEDEEPEPDEQPINTLPPPLSPAKQASTYYNGAPTIQGTMSDGVVVIATVKIGGEERKYTYDNTGRVTENILTVQDMSWSPLYNSYHRVTGSEYIITATDSLGQTEFDTLSITSTSSTYTYYQDGTYTPPTTKSTPLPVYTKTGIYVDAFGSLTTTYYTIHSSLNVTDALAYSTYSTTDNSGNVVTNTITTFEVTITENDIPTTTTLTYTGSGYVVTSTDFYGNPTLVTSVNEISVSTDETGGIVTKTILPETNPLATSVQTVTSTDENGNTVTKTTTVTGQGPMIVPQETVTITESGSTRNGIAPTSTARDLTSTTDNIIYSTEYDGTTEIIVADADGNTETETIKTDSKGSIVTVNSNGDTITTITTVQEGTTLTTTLTEKDTTLITSTIDASTFTETYTIYTSDSIALEFPLEGSFTHSPDSTIGITATDTLDSDVSTTEITTTGFNGEPTTYTIRISASVVTDPTGNTVLDDNGDPVTELVTEEIGTDTETADSSGNDGGGESTTSGSGSGGSGSGGSGSDESTTESTTSGSDSDGPGSGGSGSDESTTELTTSDSGSGGSGSDEGSTESTTPESGSGGSGSGGSGSGGSESDETSTESTTSESGTGSGTQTVTVTDPSGNVVTDPSGNPVTEIVIKVTDSSGNVVTDLYGKPVTETVISVTDPSGNPVTDLNGKPVTETVITVTDPSGKPVTDMNGNIVTETVTESTTSDSGSGGSGSGGSGSGGSGSDETSTEPTTSGSGTGIGTQTVTVTDSSGNVVTDPSGNPVTETVITVTDPSGNPVTDLNGKPVTETVITVTDPSGNPVTDMNGNIVTEIVTDSQISLTESTTSESGSGGSDSDGSESDGSSTESTTSESGSGGSDSDGSESDGSSTESTTSESGSDGSDSDGSSTESTTSGSGGSGSGGSGTGSTQTSVKWNETVTDYNETCFIYRFEQNLLHSLGHKKCPFNKKKPFVQQMPTEVDSTGFALLWNEEHKALMLTDKFAKQILKQSPESGKWIHIYLAAIHVDAIIPTIDPEVYVIVVDRTIVSLTTTFTKDEVIVTYNKLFATFDSSIGFSVARTDHAGRLWLSVRYAQDSIEKENLYMICNGTATVQETTIEKTGGMAWSPNKKHFYISDLKSKIIYVYDYNDKKGTIQNQQTVIDFKRNKEFIGTPHDIAVDSKGDLWVAMFGNQEVIKINGVTWDVEEIIVIPNAYPVSLAFGEPRLNRLFVTTAFNKETHSFPFVYAIGNTGVKGYNPSHPISPDLVFGSSTMEITIEGADPQPPDTTYPVLPYIESDLPSSVTPYTTVSKKACAFTQNAPIIQVTKADISTLGIAAHYDKKMGAIFMTDVAKPAAIKWKESSGEAVILTFEDVSLTTTVIPIKGESEQFIVAEDKQIVVLENAFKHSHTVPKSHKKIIAKLSDSDANLDFNRGRTDTKGRLWIGTRYAVTEQRKACKLYLLHKKTLKEMDDGYTKVGGMTWSKDNSKLYVADAGEGVIYEYKYKESTGEISDRLEMFSLNNTPYEKCAIYDIVVDSEDHIWAPISGCRVVIQISPMGEITREIAIPGTFPNVVEFGGEKRDTLFVATMRAGPAGCSVDNQAKLYAISNLGVTAGRLPTDRFVL